MKEKDLGRACDTYVLQDRCVHVLGGEAQVKVEVLELDGRIILEYVNKYLGVALNCNDVA